MNGHARIAALAAGDMGAVGADKCWCKTASIEKQERLAAVPQVFVDGCFQGRCKPLGRWVAVQVNQAETRRTIDETLDLAAALLDQFAGEGL